MCTVPMEDGIAKATLNRMVKSSENDMAAARLGLRTVLPEGTTIDLDIAGGKARIDLSEEALNLSDAAAEANMVSAIVQALTEFDTVEEVEFLIGGRSSRRCRTARTSPARSRAGTSTSNPPRTPPARRPRAPSRCTSRRRRERWSCR